MAVLSVKEISTRRASTIENGRRTETRIFMVKCSSPLDGTTSAITGSDGTNRIPFYGEAHPQVPSCSVNSISADPVSNSTIHFEVVVKYEGVPLEAIPVHPLDRPPEYQWGANEFTQPWFKDYSDPPKLFCNSAGERFDQLFERDDSHLLITMSRNESDWNILTADQFKNTVNADIEFLDGQAYGPGVLRLGPITAQKQSEAWMGNMVDYYKVTYVFKANKDGWIEKVNDTGVYELRNGKPWPIMDGTGAATVGKPWPLDGTGKPKASITDLPAVLEFKPYRRVSWRTLNFY